MEKQPLHDEPYAVQQQPTAVSSLSSLHFFQSQRALKSAGQPGLSSPKQEKLRGRVQDFVKKKQGSRIAQQIKDSNVYKLDNSYVRKRQQLHSLQQIASSKLMTQTTDSRVTNKKDEIDVQVFEMRLLDQAMATQQMLESNRNASSGSQSRIQSKNLSRLVVIGKGKIFSGEKDLLGPTESSGIEKQAHMRGQKSSRQAQQMKSSESRFGDDQFGEWPKDSSQRKTTNQTEGRNVAIDAALQQPSLKKNTSFIDSLNDYNHRCDSGQRPDSQEVLLSRIHLDKIKKSASQLKSRQPNRARKEISPSTLYFGPQTVHPIVRQMKQITQPMILGQSYSTLGFQKSGKKAIVSSRKHHRSKGKSTTFNRDLNFMSSEISIKGSTNSQPKIATVSKGSIPREESKQMTNVGVETVDSLSTGKKSIHVVPKIDDNSIFHSTKDIVSSRSKSALYGGSLKINERNRRSIQRYIQNQSNFGTRQRNATKEFGPVFAHVESSSLVNIGTATGPVVERQDQGIQPHVFESPVVYTRSSIHKIEIDKDTTDESRRSIIPIKQQRPSVSSGVSMHHVRKGESMKDCLRSEDAQLNFNSSAAFHQSFKMAKGHTHKNSGMNLEHEYKMRNAQSSQMEDEMPQTSDNVTNKHFSAFRQQFSTERAEVTINQTDKNLQILYGSDNGSVTTKALVPEGEASNQAYKQKESERSLKSRKEATSSSKQSSARTKIFTFHNHETRGLRKETLYRMTNTKGPDEMTEEPESPDKIQRVIEAEIETGQTKVTRMRTTQPDDNNQEIPIAFDPSLFDHPGQDSLKNSHRQQHDTRYLPSPPRDQQVTHIPTSAGPKIKDEEIKCLDSQMFSTDLRKPKEEPASQGQRSGPSKKIETTVLKSKDMAAAARRGSNLTLKQNQIISIIGDNDHDKRFINTQGSEMGSFSKSMIFAGADRPQTQMSIVRYDGSTQNSQYERKRSSIFEEDQDYLEQAKFYPRSRPNCTDLTKRSWNYNNSKVRASKAKQSQKGSSSEVSSTLVPLPMKQARLSIGKSSQMTSNQHSLTSLKFMKSGAQSRERQRKIHEKKNEDIMRIIDFFVQAEAKEKSKEMSKMREVSQYVNQVEVSGEKSKIISLLKTNYEKQLFAIALNQQVSQGKLESDDQILTFLKENMPQSEPNESQQDAKTTLNRTTMDDWKSPMMMSMNLSEGKGPMENTLNQSQFQAQVFPPSPSCRSTSQKTTDINQQNSNIMEKAAQTNPAIQKQLEAIREGPIQKPVVSKVMSPNKGFCRRPKTTDNNGGKRKNWHHPSVFYSREYGPGTKLPVPQFHFLDSDLSKSKNTLNKTGILIKDLLGDQHEDNGSVLSKKAPASDPIFKNADLKTIKRQPLYGVEDLDKQIQKEKNEKLLLKERAHQLISRYTKGTQDMVSEALFPHKEDFKLQNLESSIQKHRAKELLKAAEAYFSRQAQQPPMKKLSSRSKADSNSSSGFVAGFKNKVLLRNLSKGGEKTSSTKVGGRSKSRVDETMPFHYRSAYFAIPDHNEMFSSSNTKSEMSTRINMPNPINMIEILPKEIVEDINPAMRTLREGEDDDAREITEVTEKANGAKSKIEAQRAPIEAFKAPAVEPLQTSGVVCLPDE